MKPGFFSNFGIVYFLVALPILLVLQVLRPPFSSPDEWSHVARAAQIADGKIITDVKRPKQPPEGMIDLSFLQMAVYLHQHRFQKMTVLMPRLEEYRWSDKRLLHNYNSTVYFPATYLGQALAIKLGQKAKLNIISTVKLSNIVTGLFVIAVLAGCFQYLQQGRAFAFAVCLLPMSLFQFGATSPDGPLIALLMILVTLATRRNSGLDVLSWQAFLAIVSAVIVVATKLVYFPVVAALLAITFRGNLLRLAGSIALCLVVALAWHKISGASVVSYTWDLKIGDQSAQSAFLISHPGAIWQLAVNTLEANTWQYLHQMVGWLGWLDAPISEWGVTALLTCLVAAMIMDMARRGSFSVSVGYNALLAAGILASCGLIFLGIYLINAPVGSLDPIVGVQGRYFLPLLLAMCPLLPRRTWEAGALIVLAATLAISTTELTAAILNRYYI